MSSGDDARALDPAAVTHYAKSSMGDAFCGSETGGVSAWVDLGPEVDDQVTCADCLAIIAECTHAAPPVNMALAWAGIRRPSLCGLKGTTMLNPAEATCPACKAMLTRKETAR